MTNIYLNKIKQIPKHTILLVGIILFVFIFPLFEKGFLKEILITTSYSTMLLSVASLIEFKTKWLLHLIIIAVAFQWINFFIDYGSFPILNYLAFSFSLLIFSIATLLLVRQIISSKRVDTQLIIETITGYLLIGVIFTLINVLLQSYNHQAIGFINENPSLGDIIYYSFVTFTTIGYGDISPISQAARGFAIFFGLTGQLYITIIIAFIIGKYLNTQNIKN